MANVWRIEIDEQALKHAVGHADGMRGVLDAKTQEIAGRANAMGAGFRTGLYYEKKHHPKPGVGNKQPEYAGDVQMGKYGYIGLVHPANYAALKDTYLHNTLLKAGGQ